MNQPKKCQQEASSSKAYLQASIRFCLVGLACSSMSVSGCSNSNDDAATKNETGKSQSVANNEVGKIADKSDKSAKAEASITLVIDYGDPEKENRTFDGITVTNGSTVLDLMNQLIQDGKTNARTTDSKFEETGLFVFQHKGSGETAFLESIDGIKNEGASGRNWMYYVNEEKAVVGFGKYQLNDGDSVAWKFKVQD